MYEGKNTLYTLREYYITTLVAFITAIDFDWFICIVEVSDSQKQSFNDAFLKCRFIPHAQCCTSELNDAKLQKKYENSCFVYVFFSFLVIWV